MKILGYRIGEKAPEAPTAALLEKGSVAPERGALQKLLNTNGTPVPEVSRRDNAVKRAFHGGGDLFLIDRWTMYATEHTNTPADDVKLNFMNDVVLTDTTQNWERLFASLHARIDLMVQKGAVREGKEKYDPVVAWYSVILTQLARASAQIPVPEVPDEAYLAQARRYMAFAQDANGFLEHVQGFFQYNLGLGNEQDGPIEMDEKFPSRPTSVRETEHLMSEYDPENDDPNNIKEVRLSVQPKAPILGRWNSITADGRINQWPVDVNNRTQALGEILMLTPELQTIMQLARDIAQSAYISSVAPTFMEFFAHATTRYDIPTLMQFVTIAFCLRDAQVQLAHFMQDNRYEASMIEEHRTNALGFVFLHFPNGVELILGIPVKAQGRKYIPEFVATIVPKGQEDDANIWNGTYTSYKGENIPQNRVVDDAGKSITYVSKPLLAKLGLPDNLQITWEQLLLYDISEERVSFS